MPGPNDAPETVLEAGCKINLFLRVTGRRKDGYHTLESFFLPLSSPADSLRVARTAQGGLRFSCSDASLEGNANLVVRAYSAFARATGYEPGLTVFLEKRIPCGSGLGGGSSDAAALLRYLNTEASQEGGGSLALPALERLAAELGADVPFFLHNRPAFVRGIGEIVEPAANPAAGLYLVLVAPEVHVPTAWAFAAWDEKNGGKLAGPYLTNGEGEDTSPHVRGIRVENDLAPVVFTRCPQLRDVAASLRARKAAAVSMSGSGSSIFGLFEEKRDAEKALRFFRAANERVFFHPL